MTAPWRRRQDPLEPPPAVQVELVVARYRESVRWVRNVPSSVQVTIYDKGGDLDPALLPWARVEPLPNVGHEGHTYLHHLATRHDTLAPVTVFCQGHPFDHAWDLHPWLRDLVAGRREVRDFQWIGFIIDTDDSRGRRLFVPWDRNSDGRELAVDEFHEALLGTSCPSVMHFYLGAQFAVAAECVRRRPREFYRRACALAASFPDAAHCLERIWDRVFGVVGVDPAFMEARQTRHLRSTRRLREGMAGTDRPA
ncbi:MAG TPA: DUF3431 domain-containing protein [Myxococcota bacterium]|nr:DUF3431 domain-containing protein [Myxococcota bacterium]HQK52335.1 DUF3431 domain-containing protein [Myxococcota bacterium]